MKCMCMLHLEAWLIADCYVFVSHLLFFVYTQSPLQSLSGSVAQSQQIMSDETNIHYLIDWSTQGSERPFCILISHFTWIMKNTEETDSEGKSLQELGSLGQHSVESHLEDLTTNAHIEQLGDWGYFCGSSSI